MANFNTCNGLHGCLDSWILLIFAVNVVTAVSRMIMESHAWINGMLEVESEPSAVGVATRQVLCQNLLTHVKMRSHHKISRQNPATIILKHKDVNYGKLKLRLAGVC